MLLLTAALAMTGALTAAQDARPPIAACTPSARVWVQAGEDWLPGTLTGASPGAGKCAVLLDDHLRAGPQPAEMAYMTADKAPPAPSARMLELGRVRDADPARQREMRGLAEQTHANARIYLSHYLLTVNDSLIVSRICNADPRGALCHKANGQFHNGVTANNVVIDERNRKAEAEERAARANSEPVNSGFYTKGAGSVNGSTPYTPSSGATTSSTPVKVQSESEIRKGQAACRAGSGPC